MLLEGKNKPAVFSVAKEIFQLSMERKFILFVKNMLHPNLESSHSSYMGKTFKGNETAPQLRVLIPTTFREICFKSVLLKS